MIGMEKLRLRTAQARSVTGSFDEVERGDDTGPWIRHWRFETSERSISAVAIVSSEGCSRDMEIWVDDKALTSKMIMFSRSGRG